MARLFAAARLHVNFFQPSFKLKEKRREGAKVIKRYHAPVTPYERALAHPGVEDAAKARLREIYRMLDPVALLAEMRNMQTELGQRVDRRPSSAPVISVLKQNDHLGKLGENWSEGEHRAIHRRPYVRRKPVPRRPSMLDLYVPLMEEWLAAAPHMAAIQILARLIEHGPDRFGAKQQRTVERFVKNWRAKAARHLIASTEAVIRIESESVEEIEAQTAQPEALEMVRIGP
jgi:hypothetical protein